jgi:hypothetical protein
LREEFADGFTKGRMRDFEDRGKRWGEEWMEKMREAWWVI